MIHTNSNNEHRAENLFDSAVALMSSVLDGDTGDVRDEYRGETWSAIHHHLVTVTAVVSSLSNRFGDTIEKTYETIARNAKLRATTGIVGIPA